MNKIKEDWWTCNFQTSGFRKKHLGEFLRGKDMKISLKEKCLTLTYNKNKSYDMNFIYKNMSYMPL